MKRNIFYNGQVVDTFEVSAPVVSRKRVRRGKQPRDHFGQFASWNAKPITRAIHPGIPVENIAGLIAVAFIVAALISYIK